MAEWDRSPRSDAKLLTALHADVAVAPNPNGPQVGCADACLPTADRRSGRTRPKLTIPQHRDVSRGPPHVHDDGVVQTCQELSANGACRRARQDCLYRTLAGHFLTDERAITLDHHERRADPQLSQHFLDRVEQVLDHRQQPGIEHCRGDPLQGIELARQLVTADYRRSGPTLDHRTNVALMFRVHDAKIA